MFVRTDKNKYHVAFELDRRRPQAVTECKIFWLPDKDKPILMGCGKTLQSKKDVFNSITGCKFALTRALRAAYLNKPARTAFWKEFNRHHRLRPDIVTCREAFASIGGRFEGSPKRFFDVTGPFDRRLYPHQRRAMTFAVGGPIPDNWVERMYRRSRHEYGETVLPRSRAVKNEQYYKMYGGLPKQQAEGRCHRVGTGKTIHIINSISHGDQLKAMLENKNRVLDIINADRKRLRWLYGLWAVDDEKKPHWAWLRRVWSTLRQWWVEAEAEIPTEAEAEIPGRELFNKLDRDYCDNCEGNTVFLEGPRGGSCLNIKCKSCGQKYWLDPMTRTAKKL